MELWAQVIEIPEHNRIIVFNIGIFIGLNVLIPLGGQFNPNSILGDSLLCKKAQKNEEKNKTSEIINIIIPNFILATTFLVWSPWNVDSRTTSRHHWIIVNKIINVPKVNSKILNKWNHIIIPDVIVISPIDPVNGHGLLSTKWKGWLFIL